jgi:hypothetical protein
VKGGFDFYEEEFIVVNILYLYGILRNMDIIDTNEHHLFYPRV